MKGVNLSQGNAVDSYKAECSRWYALRKEAKSELKESERRVNKLGEDI